jgi:SAM-dependent methyltransferase
MSHPSMQSFVKEILCSINNIHNINNSRLLEIGSYDVNGSIRAIVQSAINPTEHIGVDLINGPNVDLVCSGSEVDLPDESFDLTVSFECLEHNPYWAETLANMRRMTKAKGYVIVSCATLGRLEHGTTRTDPVSSPGTQGVGWNYYKNLTAADFDSSFLSSFKDYYFWENKYSKDLYFIGSVGEELDFKSIQFEFINMKPLSGFKKKIFVDFPINLAQKILSENNFQIFGVSYLKLGRKFKRFII